MGPQPRFVQQVRERFAVADAPFGEGAHAPHLPGRERVLECGSQFVEADAAGAADQPRGFVARVVRAVAVVQARLAEGAFRLAPELADGGHAGSSRRSSARR